MPRGLLPGQEFSRQELHRHYRESQQRSQFVFNGGTSPLRVLQVSSSSVVTTGAKATRSRSAFLLMDGPALPSSSVLLDSSRFLSLASLLLAFHPPAIYTLSGNSERGWDGARGPFNVKSRHITSFLSSIARYTKAGGEVNAQQSISGSEQNC